MAAAITYQLTCHMHVPLAGSYNSTVVRMLPPPATKTLPEFTAWREADATNRQVASRVPGSALAGHTVQRQSPDQQIHCHLPQHLAEAQCRAVGPTPGGQVSVPVQLLPAGSNNSALAK